MEERISRPSAPDAWERWAWIWSAVFCGSLLLPLVILLAEGQLAGAELRLALLLTAVVLVLHGLAFWGLPSIGAHLRAHPLLGTVYSVSLALLIGWLIAIHPTFSFALAGFFSQVFYAVDARIAIPIVFSATVLLGALSVDERAIGPILSAPTFWLWVLGGVTGALIALWFNAIIDQSAQRQALIDELRRAHADLAEAEREAGILVERQRLAREIHDTLAQGLISIIAHLDVAAQALDDDDRRRLAHHLGRAQRTARTNLGEARRVVQNLRPELMDDASLPDAVARVVAHWADDCGVAAECHVTGTVAPLEADVEVTLLRVVQEALANVAKHADATNVAVTLSYMPDCLLLDVQDDGRGLQRTAADALLSTGFGLRSMRERVVALGGTVALESEPDEGTTVVVEVPLTVADSG